MWVLVEIRRNWPMWSCWLPSPKAMVCNSRKTQGKLMFQFLPQEGTKEQEKNQSCRWSLKAVCCKSPLFMGESQPFCSLRPLTDYIRLANIMESNLLSSSFLIYMLTSSKNTLTAIPKTMSDQISEHPIKLPQALSHPYHL